VELGFTPIVMSKERRLSMLIGTPKLIVKRLGLAARWELSHNQERKNQMTKILIAYIIGLIVGAGATLCIVEQLLK
jgi:hypothetical protein